MPCLDETRLREVNTFHNSKNVAQYNRNVNSPHVNVSRVNKATEFCTCTVYTRHVYVR